MFPRYYRNRIGFAQTSDGKQTFLIRVDATDEAWMLFTDGTQRRLTRENVAEWCDRGARDPGQPMDEVPAAEAERLVDQNRSTH